MPITWTLPAHDQDPWDSGANNLNTAINTIGNGVNALEAATAQRPPALVQWRAQAANRLYGVVNTVWVGSSTTFGLNATTTFRRYTDRLGALLHTALPVPGVVGGYYIAAGETTGWTSGGTSALDTNGLGLASRVLQASATMAHTDTCTGFDVLYQQGPGAGAFTVQVDAGTPVAVTPNTTGTANRGDGFYSSPGVGVSSHTVTITATAATAINGIYVRNGDETTGIRVYSSGKTSSLITDWSGSSRTFFQRLAQLGPPLIGIMLGANEYAANTNPATFQTALQSLVDQIKGAVTPTPSILIVATYKRLDVASPSFPWSQYQTAMAAVAAADPANVAYLDISAPYPLTQQLNAATATLDTDLTHQTDKGHSEMADLLLQPFITPAPSTVPTSTFTPAKIGSLLAWWTADSLTQSDSTGVASWPVAAGLENATLTQATTGNQPIYRTNQVNGKAAVLFTSANSHNLDSGAWSAVRPVPKTAFAVVNYNVGNTGNVFTGRAGVYCYMGAGTGVVVIGAGNVGELPATMSFGAWHVVGMVYNAAASQIYVDSRTATVTGTTSSGGNSALPGVRMGTNSTAGGVFYDGATAALALFDRVLNAQEITAMMTYLGSLYGITIA